MQKIVSAGDIQTALNQRYATKMFDTSKTISPEDEKALLESLRLSPSSFGLQPWKWIVVKNKDLRKELRTVSWNQSQVEEPPLYIVFAVRKEIGDEFIQKFIDHTEKVRGLPAGALKGYYDVITGSMAAKGAEGQRPWAERQSYISMGFLGLTASLLGIDACMLEGLDPAAYDKLLGLEGGEYSTVAAVALGYRNSEDTYATLAKSRFDVSEVIEVK